MSNISIPVEVTQKTEPTRSGNGVMQTVGVEAGGLWPLEQKVFIRDGEQPMKPGKYICTAIRSPRADEKCYGLIVDIQPSTLEPVKAG